MELLLIRGTPGSGKSTLARKIMFEYNLVGGWRHLETDMYFEMDQGSYIFDATKLGSAHKWCINETDYELSRGKSVIVSNTFTTKKELKPYFELAKKYNIIPNVILCQNNCGSIHNVPEVTIKRMKNRFQIDITELFEGL